MSPRRQQVVESRGAGGIRVLSVGRIAEVMAARSALLRSAGYTVSAARTTADAMALLSEPHHVVVFGHAVPEAERNLIAGAARKSCPGVKVIMLYIGAIQNAELADALLAANGSPQALIRAIEHLTSGAREKSVEAS